MNDFLINFYRIKVKTPNIVMVFSNDEPKTSRLAKDRLKLFSIENELIKERNIYCTPLFINFDIVIYSKIILSCICYRTLG